MGGVALTPGKVRHRLDVLLGLSGPKSESARWFRGGKFYAQVRRRLNPSPCGYFGDLKRECRCGSIQVQRYRQRISGPLLDRIDLHIEVPAVEYRDISSTREEEASATICDRVGKARERQRARFHSDRRINCNARMGTRQIKQHCKLATNHRN